MTVALSLLLGLSVIFYPEIKNLTGRLINWNCEEKGSYRRGQTTTLGGFEYIWPLILPLQVVIAALKIAFLGVRGLVMGIRGLPARLSSLSWPSTLRRKSPKQGKPAIVPKASDILLSMVIAEMKRNPDKVSTSGDLLFFKTEDIRLKLDTINLVKPYAWSDSTVGGETVDLDKQAIFQTFKEILELKAKLSAAEDVRKSEEKHLKAVSKLMGIDMPEAAVNISELLAIENMKNSAPTLEELGAQIKNDLLQPT